MRRTQTAQARGRGASVALAFAGCGRPPSMGTIRACLRHALRLCCAVPRAVLLRCAPLSDTRAARPPARPPACARLLSRDAWTLHSRPLTSTGAQPIAVCSFDVGEAGGEAVAWWPGGRRQEDRPFQVSNSMACSEDHHNFLHEGRISWAPPRSPRARRCCPGWSVQNRGLGAE